MWAYLFFFFFFKLFQQKLKSLIMCFKCFPDRGHYTAGNPHTYIRMLLESKIFIFSEWECSCQCKHSAAILCFCHPISCHKMKTPQNSFPWTILKINQLINVFFAN